MSVVPRLTLIPYLKAWDGAAAQLALNVLVVPDGDPFAPLTEGFPTSGPPVWEAALTLTANLSSDVDELPILGETTAEVSVPLQMPGASERKQVFEALEALFRPSIAAALPVRSAERTLHKYLTPSYREAFAFVAPRTSLASVDEDYKCMLRCPPKESLPTPKPPQYSWIDALGYALRQPLVLREAGLLHTVSVTLPSADLFANGGWLFLTLDPASDYASSEPLPGFLRSFATRVPALSATTQRPIFTAVLFPVFADATDAAAAGAAYDEVFPEAIRFDDGFAKIVHAAQQETMMHLDAAGESPPPLQDLGIFLGWDDEDVLLALNRQIGLNPDGTEPAEAPCGTLGYRVDARIAGAAKWTSLAEVEAAQVPLGASLDLGEFKGELQSEVHPRSLGEELWLPAYFTNWTGGSLVVDSEEDEKLRGVRGANPSPYTPADLGALQLRYGQSYEFRVRLADTSGGGPALTEDPFNTGQHPTAQIAFKRYVPPAAPLVEEQGPLPGPLKVKLARPLLGYPAALYAGIPNAIAELMAIFRHNEEHPTEVKPLGLPDVDASYVEVRVLVRTPTFDPAATFDDWLEVHTTTRQFEADGTVELTAGYVDVAQLSTLNVTAQEGPPGSIKGPLPIPTARDVRLEVRALCRDDATYFANEAARRSLPVTIEFHQPAKKELEPLRPVDPTLDMHSVYLQPDSVAEEEIPAVVQSQNDPSTVLVQRLAQAAGLSAAEDTLLGLPGQRVVFGCAGLGHALSPDGGSVTLTHMAELPGQWLNVVRVELNRDWTWKGAGTPALRLKRALAPLPGGVGHGQGEEVTTVQLMHAVNSVATEDEPERECTVVVFIDAFKAPLEGGLPHELEVDYKVELLLEGGGSEEVALTNTLPVTTPPRQIPQVAAAGYALSDYQTDGAYANTGDRTRMLWLELAEPLHDPRDAYFARVLAHSPDPLLLARAEPAADPPAYQRSVLDPELVRTITPGEADDLAGLATMQKLIPAQGSDRHFLVPLPPGVPAGSPDLLGFYTYEIRVGHDRGTAANPFWSTAQGRFGEALVLEGVQHPAPPLTCGVTRLEEGVLITAPYACPFYEGAAVLPNPPNTEIWVALYAQVHQADGASMRNIQLALQSAERLREGARAVPTRQEALPAASGPGAPSGPLAVAGFTDAELEALLAEYGLGPNTPLSVLAIELIPEPNTPFGDPLRSELGEVRILRTSRLVAIEGVCC